MPDWSISIVASPRAVAGAPAEFVPQDGTAGQPLCTYEDDIVYWYNRTNDKHQPWPTDENWTPLEIDSGSPLYLSDEIAPGMSSDAYDIPAEVVDPVTGVGTIYYICKCHPQMHGTIVVQAVPSVPPAPPPQD